MRTRYSYGYGMGAFCALWLRRGDLYAMRIFGHWLSGPLSGLYAEVASAEALRSLPGADPCAAERWLTQHRARREDRGAALWALFAFCWWHRGPRVRDTIVGHHLVPHTLGDGEDPTVPGGRERGRLEPEDRAVA